MGTLFIAVFSAFGVLFVSVGLNQQIARASNEATSLTEAIERVPYVNCATPTSYTAQTLVGGVDSNPVNAAIGRLSDQYSFAITQVEYLTNAAATTSAFQTTCPVGGDQGVQRLRVRVQTLATEHRTSTVIVFTKRNTTCPDPALRPAEIVDGQPC